MAISYKLEKFEGPLDLLLHLIEKNKVDIYDIPIVEITKQYLDYVNQMEKEDLNIVSDFLVMAATLLDIKSRMLLPVPEIEEGEEEQSWWQGSWNTKNTSLWHRNWPIWKTRREMCCLKCRPCRKRLQSTSRRWIWTSC